MHSSLKLQVTSWSIMCCCMTWLHAKPLNASGVMTPDAQENPAISRACMRKDLGVVRQFRTFLYCRSILKKAIFRTPSDCSTSAWTMRRDRVNVPMTSNLLSTLFGDWLPVPLELSRCLQIRKVSANASNLTFGFS